MILFAFFFSICIHSLAPRALLSAPLLRGIGFTYLIHVEKALVLLDLSFANVEMCGKVYPDEKGEVVDDAVIMSSHILRQRMTISIKNGNEKYWGHSHPPPGRRCWHHIYCGHQDKKMRSQPLDAGTTMY